MMDDKRVPLTQDAYDRLKAELEYLEGEGRQNIIDEIARARAHGDLSENAEYHAAKDEQGRQEARAREIRHTLENSEIITTGRGGDVVMPGMLVTLKYEEGEPETYLFATRAEISDEHEVLTPESPIGRSINGKAVGETVTARTPGGEMKIEISGITAT